MGMLGQHLVTVLVTFGKYGRRGQLVRETLAPCEVHPSWIASKDIEYDILAWWHDLDIWRSGTVLISFFQPVKRSIVFTKTGMDSGKQGGFNVAAA